MNAAFRHRSSGAGRHDLGGWPLMGLLALVIVVPTVSLLWFMTRAMQNERLAVQQKLVAFHQQQLDTVGLQWQNAWAQRLADLVKATSGFPGPSAFFAAVDGGLADAIVLFDEHGQRIYPEPLPVAVAPRPDDSDWRAAVQLEARGNAPTAAAEAFTAVAEAAAEPACAARAWRAAARGRARAGDVPGAVDLLTGTLAAPRFAEARDTRGHLIVANAELRALELIGDPSDDRFRVVADRLSTRLTDYGAGSMPARQRRFLADVLSQLDPDRPPHPTTAAEALAARWLAWPEGRLTEVTAPSEAALHATGLPDVWSTRLPASPGGPVATALLSTASIRGVLHAAPAWAALSPDFNVNLLTPADPLPDPDAVAIPAGNDLPGWRLALTHDDRSLFDDSAQRQITAYLWTGLLAITATLALAALIARAVRQQVRATRLKNDLVATVSHELKTPLASMRLLVDTLLEAEQNDAVRVREYLQLIGHENTRLTRLIENFLTFSRLEQNRYAFHSMPLDPGTVAEAAAAAVRERFDEPGAKLSIETATNLPRVFGDQDALVTALVNLLDNAHKYTGDDKQVVLRVAAQGDQVCFAVSDNGVGVDRAAAGRVFARFYQVDPAGNAAGGVGLGLSIVRAIAAAHGGLVKLDSEPGRGSTFTLKIPTPPPAHGSPPNLRLGDAAHAR